MHCDDERFPNVLASIGSTRQLFASNGIDLGAYTDDQVADALLTTCPAILGSEAWLNEKHLLRTIRLLRLQLDAG
jgi:hypothetical protein